VLALLVPGLALGQTTAAPRDPVAQALEERVERLQATGTLALAGGTVVRSDVLVELYRQGGFAPLWSDLGARADLLRALREVDADGLLPRDYHLAALEADGVGGDPARAAELDLLRTDALVRVAHDLRF